MKLQVLKCNHGDKTLSITRELLEYEALSNFSVSNTEIPTAYVITLNDMDGLLKSHGDIIENRGYKKPSIQLSRYLLGRNKIPAVCISAPKGGYGSPKRAINGIRDLLKEAEQRKPAGGDKNIFFLAASHDLFESILKTTCGDQVIRTSLPSEKSVPEECSNVETPTRLIDLLCNVSVPMDLEKAYVGKSEPVRLVRKLIMQVAVAKDPVLILGDTGTGKEIVAKQIHLYSGRTKNNFRAINCAAIPSELFESELFGIEDKVATSVGKRIGKWELANNGTLFLDEIGELSLHHQAKILRALQENRIMRVGGSREIEVNARVITATNRNLFSLVQREKFREDLYYRLRGLLIPTPAIREHQEDIPVLADHLWKKITGGNGKKLSHQIISELCSYSWPGNVRELFMVLSGLHSLFYDLPEIEIKHLRGFFAHQRQIMEQDAIENGSMRTGREQLDYLKSLNKIYDIVKTAQMSIKSIIDRNTTMDKNELTEIRFLLQYRLDELNMRLQGETRPLPRPIYDKVTRLYSSLQYFSQVLEKDQEAAVLDLKSNAPSDFGAAIASLNNEIRKIKEDGFNAVS